MTRKKRVNGVCRVSQEAFNSVQLLSGLGAVHKLCRLIIGDFDPLPPSLSSFYYIKLAAFDLPSPPPPLLLRRHSLWTAPKQIFSNYYIFFSSTWQINVHLAISVIIFFLKYYIMAL